MKQVRALLPSDRSAWDPLWQGYLKFYKTELSDEQSDLTWQRLLDPNFNLHCLVAEVDGVVQGITHYSFQNSTWAPKNYCYLEDLYVEPTFRGGGIGRLLIDGVKSIANAAGSSRLYWNTDATNETARKLYDSYVMESGKVQYRIALNTGD
ncbi:MAG: GNAT family N-acetyltransferase [Candidatus Nanopelagicaceae bacterium]